MVWRAFGPGIANYVEPFFGSGAVLLARPNGAGKIETVNDADRYLANFWRAVAADPTAVAQHADWPVNEADLHARHKCVHSDEAHQSRQIPNLRVESGAAGVGIHASGFMREASSPGRRPALSQAGQGVHLPSLGNDRGLNGIAAAPCVEWFLRLQARLRRVRVACGDWTRVLGPSVLGKGKKVGGRRPCAVFLDPPYSHEFRDPYLYSEDDADISAKVREWALDHGDDPDLRIALCGYAGEHEMPSSWREFEWRAARGYASEDNENRAKERIWFSPHCLPLEAQRGLFEATADACRRSAP